MINKYPQVSFIYDRRKIATANKKASVDLRITYEGKQKIISTGVLLYPHQWKKGNIVNCPDSLEISQILDNLIKNVRKIILEMVEEGNIEISSIPDRLSLMNKRTISFWEFCEERAKVRKYGLSSDSQLRYDRFLKFFKQWGQIKYFEDITDKNIIAYDEYLKRKRLKASSKWNNYHRFLNSFILDAISAGHIRKNPYEWVKIDKSREDSLHKCLTPNEFNRLKTAPMPTDKLIKVRDVFVFQTYTCLRYSDLRNFDATKIREIKGMPVYLGDSIKTDKPFTIPLLTPALEILHKYDGQLPIISNAKYNEYLKLVAQAAGIDKPISTHWARHTGATLLLNLGAEMKIVTKVCGHSSTRITEQVYAKLLNETVVDAIQEISDRLK